MKCRYDDKAAVATLQPCLFLQKVVQFEQDEWFDATRNGR